MGPTVLQKTMPQPSTTVLAPQDGPVLFVELGGSQAAFAGDGGDSSVNDKGCQPQEMGAPKDNGLSPRQSTYYLHAKTPKT